MATHSKVLIIGSGPAGYTAAIYASRAQLAPTLLAGEEPGGQLMYTTDIENFPGFPEGKSGQDLMIDMLAQAQRFGTTVQYEFATAIDVSQRPFKVWTNISEGVTSKDIKLAKPETYLKWRTQIMTQAPAYTTDALIFALGASSIPVGAPGEEAFMGKGVSTCAVCDAAFYKEKTTFVIGGGDSAMEDALALTKFAKSVTIIHRRDSFRASKIMQERVLQHPKIQVLWNSSLKEVKGNEQVNQIIITTPSGDQMFEADGVFVAIGHKPMTSILSEQVALDAHGYVVTRVSHSQAGVQAAQHALQENLVAFPTTTSVEGVFAAGDCVDVRYKQAISAAGMGCMAALDAERWLESR